ncbi:MAG: hypothetical protein D6730_03120 [Bacteroidetes bacterium]|nr:MAG: hypothetical protein D6730_03120 [Bacteroidota bacterium]
MKKIVYSLAFAHLLLVTLVIFHGLDKITYTTFLEKPMAFLASVNYSAWRFGFFTPDVGKSTEVEIILSNDAGDSLRYSTLEGFDFFTSNWESENRFYGFKVHSAADTNFQNLSTRSACTYMLNMHPPGYKRISYSMRGIRYPKMQAFTQDSAIKKAEFYRVEYELY